MSMDDIPPDVLEDLIGQYLAEQEGAPPLTGEQGNFYGMMPQYDLEGDPYDLNKQLNAMQDVNQLMADPVFQGMSGPGAFGARAFQPRVRWEAVESPEYIRWQNYLASPTSFEGMVAAELEGGGTPYSAIRKIRAKALENPEGALAQELQAMYPQEDNAGPIPGEINWTMISDAATKIDELRAAIPPMGNAGPTIAPDGSVIESGGEVMEIEGPDGRPQLVRRIEEPTEMMEKFDELGYPYPTEQYTPESFMGPDWAQARDEFEATAGVPDQLLDQYRQSYQDYLNYREPTPRGTANEGADNEGGGYEGTPRPQDVRWQPTNPGSVYAEYLERTAATPAPEAANAGLPTPETPATSSAYDQFVADLTPIVTTPSSDNILPDVYAVVSTRAEDANLTREQLNSALQELSEIQRSGGAAPAPAETGQPTMAELVASGEALGPPTPAPGAAQPQGFAGTPQLGGQVPAGAYSYTAPRDYQGQVPGRTFYPQGEEPPPEPIDWTNNELPTSLELNGPAYAQPGAQPARQPGDVDYAGSPSFFDSMRDWVLSQGPGYAMPGAEPARQPGDVPYVPPYAAPGAQPARQPGDVPYVPTYAQPGAEPARQPGGPGFQQGYQPPRDVQREAAAAQRQYLEAMVRQQLRTGERPEEEEGGPPVPSIITGEERAAEEHRNKPSAATRALGGEYNVLGGDRTRRGMKRQIAEGDFREWMTAKRARGRQNQEVYSNDWARALRAVYEAQLAGATPTQQVYAQRQQNIRNAGIPLQSNPRVLQV